MLKVLESDVKHIDDIVENNPLLILYFYTDWCAPCKNIGSTMEKLSEEYPEILILKIDANNSLDLAKEYRVKSVPTLIFYKQGEILSSTSGSVSPAEIISLISDLIE